MIEIYRGLWTTSFDADFFNIGDDDCEICGDYILDDIYVYIINCLKEANLLPEGFKKRCCECYVIKNEMGGNYHKGCNKPLKYGKTIEFRGICIKCGECGKTVGKIIENENKDGLISEIYGDVEERYE